MSTAVADRTVSKTEKEPVRIKFRLLRGRHSEKVPDPNDETGEKRIHVSYQVERDPVTKLPVQPVFETVKELDKIYNCPGFAPKFERVGEATHTILNPLDRGVGETVQAYLARLAELQNSIKDTIAEKLKEVDELRDDELQLYAEAEEISLGAASTPAQMRAVIKKYFKGA